MSAIRGHAHGLADWSGRDPWRERVGLMMEKHLRKACDLNDLAIEELAEVIGPLAMTALDCAFEDFCTTVWEDGGNLASDYLKRRGWKGPRSTVPSSVKRHPHLRVKTTSSFTRCRATERPRGAR